MTLRVLVTGGSGFVGAHTVRALLDAGHEVAVVGPPVPGPDALAGLPVTSFGGDVRDPIDLLAAITSFRCEVIVHLAAYGGSGDGLVPAATANPYEAVRTNVGGLANVLEAARLACVGRVIWTSTTALLGEAERYPPGEVDEDVPVFPPHLYAASKAMGEHVGRAFAARHGLQVLAMRPTLVGGPGGWYRGIQHGLAELCVAAATGQPACVEDPGETWDLLYVKDCAAALAHLCSVDWGGTDVVHVSGHRASVGDVLREVRSVVPDARIEVRPVGRRLGIPFVSTARAAALGFAPRYDLRRAVLDFLETARAGRAGPLARPG